MKHDAHEWKAIPMRMRWYSCWCGATGRKNDQGEIILHGEPHERHEYHAGRSERLTYRLEGLDLKGKQRPK